jgi:hypothetical protein
MAKQDKFMKVRYLSTFIYKLNEVGPKDTKEAPASIPSADARFLISNGLAVEATDDAASDGVNGDTVKGGKK